MTMQTNLAATHQWLLEPMPADVAAAVARLAMVDDAVHLAVLPDVHLAPLVANGVVLATRQMIYPAAVGNDIGCGMAAVRTSLPADALAGASAAARVLAGLYRYVPCNRRPKAEALPPSLADRPLSHPRLMKVAERDGRVQLGTLGRGNHFLEFQADPEERLWLLVHTGSRGMGQFIAAHHQAGAKSLCGWPADSPAAQAYLVDATWACDYADANRLALLASAERLLAELFGGSCDWETLIHTSHNHVRREEHGSQPLWVHRKGAQPAFAGQAGLIPGSMGTPSFHIVGRGAANSLASCSHGAGRALARGDAARQISPRQCARELRWVWYDERLTRQLCTEAPSAYKDIRAVLRAQRELVQIVRELRPVLCYKGVDR